MTRTIIILLVVLATSCYAQNTCLKDADCPKSAFCLFPSGLCGAPSLYQGGKPSFGICQLIPSDCREWPKAPACGCDRQDYINPCYAWQNRTSIFLQGTCSQIKSCINNDQCSEDQYCQFSDLYCGGSNPGICAQRPNVCATNDDKMCACDGNPHRNACIAAAAGYSPWYITVCPVD